MFISFLAVGPLLLSAANSLAADEEEPPREQRAATRDERRSDRPAAKPADRKLLPWLDALARGYTQAQRAGKPMFVRAGGESCKFCRALEAEIAKSEVQQELKRWTLVAIDVDKSPDDAGHLAVGPIPALRLLTPTGRLVAAHDGFLESGELIDWLKENFEAAAVTPPAELTGDGPPDAEAVGKLIAAFKNRDATIREAAIRRLLPHPQESAAPVVSSFSEGSLSTRLAALELLEEWKAPLEGLDPWKPETITASRLRTLTDWAAAGNWANGLPAREQLSADEVRAAGDLLERLLEAPPEEAVAIRERLARFGRLLLPAVYERLKAVTTDASRERLTALRYRLVANEKLALTWPGGIERLAASDAEVRFRAADELAQRATAADEALLLELFSDPAPLVREMALKALRSVGGADANSALIRLLDDPEPNVRAAVLKQLAESPARTIVPRIAEFASTETDPDLVVHAVRVLREAKGKSAAEALIKLLSHEVWQVRAEAAESLGKFIDRYGRSPDELQADIYAAMIELLKDKDGFVISRAVDVLQHADLVAAVDPLAEAAEAHPELAGEIIQSLAYGSKQRSRAMVHIRKFADHADPRLRAAAVKSLCTIQDDDLEQRLRTALGDADADVRIAAANGLFGLMETQRASLNQARLMQILPGGDAGGVPQVIPVPEAPPPPPDNVIKSIFKLFTGQKRAPPAPARPAPPEDEMDDRSEADPPSETEIDNPSNKSDGNAIDEAQSAETANPELDKEFAEMVEKFNELYEQKNWPEAKALAKRAKRFRPENPVAEILILKAKLAERVDIEERNGELPVEEAEDEPSANSAVKRRFRSVGGALVAEEIRIVDAEEAELELSGDAPEEVVEEPTIEASSDLVESMLTEIRQGKLFPDWWKNLIPALEPMLDAARADERLAGVLPLAALGRDERAVPVLMQLASTEPRLIARIAEALPWLLAADRQKLLQELVDRSRSPVDIQAIARQLAEIRTLQGGQTLWGLLSHPSIDVASAEAVKSSLLQFYFPQNYHNLQQAAPKARKVAIEASEVRAKDGPHWQRIAALAIIQPFDAEKTAELARALADDESLAVENRADAFQILLVSLAGKEGTEAAVARAVAGPPRLRDLALAYLTQGKSALYALRDGRFYLHAAESVVGISPPTSGQPIVPKPPAGLEAEPLKPLLESGDARLAAQAGYLLALLGDPAGLPPLLEFWQAHARDDLNWMRLIYRAIARLDDGSQIDVLQEIYAKLNTDSHRHQVSEFYWTIRSMTDPEILSLRKQIRQEIGVDQLR